MTRRSVATRGDKVVGVDMHKERSDGHPIVPVPFSGTIQGDVEAGIKVNGEPVARLGSVAQDGHATSYACRHPATGKVSTGSGTVKVNGHRVARHDDFVDTCTCTSWQKHPQIIAKRNVYTS